MVDIEHDDVPIFLTPGLTFPELLGSDKQRLFRFYNADTDTMNVQFSLLSGSIVVFISNKKEDIEKSKINFTIDELSDRYKYFQIRPSDFNVKEPSEYYILIKNLRTLRASFNF